MPRDTTFINQYLSGLFADKKIDVAFLRSDLTNAPKENPFYNKKVVLTGDMEKWERSHAAFILFKLGADVNTSISKKTNIVIMGKSPGPSKLEKVTAFIAEGIEIRLMNEAGFEKAIEPYHDLIIEQ